jgi:alpha-tubulin suppressor-like RCC1 family protein
MLLYVQSVLPCASIIQTGTVRLFGPGFSGTLRDVLSVSAGPQHLLLLRTDGSIHTYGSNANGQLVIPPWVRTSNDTGVVGVAAGGDFSLLLLQNGTVVPLMSNNTMGLVMPAAGTKFTAVSAGNNFGLGLQSDGIVVARGDNTTGQCNVPLGLSSVVAIAAGAYHSLALRSDGTVVAWGDNSANQTAVPAGLANVSAIAAGFRHSMALLKNGSVMSWGAIGQANVPSPALAGGVKAIASGYSMALALLNNNTLLAWNNENGWVWNGRAGDACLAHPIAALYLVTGCNVYRTQGQACDSFLCLGCSLIAAWLKGLCQPTSRAM